jgi:hypothetical protein
MLSDIKTVQGKVQHLLEKHEVLRDDDHLLFIAYMNVFHGMRKLLGEEAYVKLRTLLLDKRTPKFEAIRRSRQKIQEGGVFLGKTRPKRLTEEENVRQYFREKL